MPVTLQVGVKVLLKNSEGKYLVLKRSAKKYPEVNNLWDIAGGRIEPGTPLLENLSREVSEETGLVLTSEPQLIAAQDILKNPEKHIVRLTYIANTEGEPVLDKEEHKEEHDEYKWLTLEEIKSLTGLDSNFKRVLPELAKRLN